MGLILLDWLFLQDITNQKFVATWETYLAIYHKDQF